MAGDERTVSCVCRSQGLIGRNHVAIPAVQTARSGSFAIWTMAFRPFFLAASAWSAAALAGWVVMLTMGLTLPSRFAPLTWHIHEMLFGFVLAAIAQNLRRLAKLVARPPPLVAACAA